MVNFKLDNELVERIYWLIRLRWVAVIGVVLVALFASQILKLPLPIFPIYTIAFVLSIYNLIFFFLAIQLKKKPLNLLQITNRIANFQISFDLTALAALTHFSGGIENPFIFYFPYGYC